MQGKRKGSTAQSAARRRGHPPDDALGRLIRAADAPVLAGLVRQLAGLSPEVQRTCFEYLGKHVTMSSDLLEDAAAGAVFALWSEIEPDLAELDDYGGGDDETQDRVGSLLYDLATKLQKDSVPRADRRALLDKVLPYIRSGNAGMADALYDAAYAACRDDEDWRDLAERFEALGKDWPTDHARCIYRRLGNREKYLALRNRRMNYGADYHDLATFHWEQGERQYALEVARTGMQHAEGRMEELRAFLAERAKEAGDTQAYLDLQFAQATEPLTLASYKAFRKLCTPQQWAVFEPRIPDAMREADDEEQIKIHMHREEHDRAVRVLVAMRYPDRRFEGDQILRVARQLEREFPEQILAFYLSGLPKHSWNAAREVYTRWARIIGKVRHMWIDVLKTPGKWDAFAQQLKLANAKRRAFQEEVSKVVSDWNQL
jgi:hypothetical protein